MLKGIIRWPKGAVEGEPVFEATRDAYEDHNIANGEEPRD
jgi:hypothetical protein